MDLLQEFNKKYLGQSEYDPTAAYAFLACLLHYNLSVALTIHFLGNNYTGAYHDIPSIVNSLRAHGIAESLILHYSRVMTVGCPNHINASTNPNGGGDGSNNMITHNIANTYNTTSTDNNTTNTSTTASI
jgi:hypothetical protein